MKEFTQLWYVIEYVSARILLGLLSLAPLPLLLVFARGVSRLSFALMRGRRRIAIDNLLQSGLCKDPTEARRLALASFHSFVLMILETVYARERLNQENWQQHVRLKIPEAAEALLHDPTQGILVASAHVGNWEVVARAVSQVKPLCAIHRPFKNPRLERYVAHKRSDSNLTLLSRLDVDPKRFLRALGEGMIVAMMIDQHAAKGGIDVQFFGRTAWTTKSVAMLHLTTRAPVLVCFSRRVGPLNYEVEVRGPLRFERTGSREEDTRNITQAITAEIEQFARQYPEQYMWGHRRWKLKSHQRKALQNTATVEGES